MSRNNNSSLEKYNNKFSQTSAAIWYRECWCHLKKIVPRHINLGKVSLHVRESKTVLDCEFHATSHLSSLRIKRCRVVSEQGKTEERRGTTRNGILGFGRTKIGTRVKKWKRGEVLIAPFFARFITLLPLFALKPHGNACNEGYH